MMPKGVEQREIEYIYTKPKGSKRWYKVRRGDQYWLLVATSEIQRRRIICTDCGKGALVYQYKIKIGEAWCFDCEATRVITHRKRAAFCHGEVAKAIADARLRKQRCERCGEKNAIAHHHDYSKPLDVNWLCNGCHATEHKQINIALLKSHAVLLNDSANRWNP